MKHFLGPIFILFPLFGLADFIDLSEHLSRVDMISMSPNGHLVAFNAGDSSITVLKGNQFVARFSSEVIPGPEEKPEARSNGPIPKGYLVPSSVDETAVKAKNNRLVLVAGDTCFYAAWLNDTVIYVVDFSGKRVSKINSKVQVRSMFLEGQVLWLFNGGYSPANNMFCEIHKLVDETIRFFKISPTKIIKPFPTKLMDFKKKVFVSANMSGGTTVYDGQVFFAPAMTQNTTVFKEKKVLSEWVFPFKYVNEFDYSSTGYAPDININKTQTNWTSRSIQYDNKNFVNQILAAEDLLYGVYQINDREDSYGNLLFCFNYKEKKLVWHKEFNDNKIFLLKADRKTVIFYDYRGRRVEALQH